MSLLVSIEMRGMGRCGAVEMNSVVSMCTFVLFRLSLSESWGRGAREAYPIYHRAEGRLHPRLVASLSHSYKNAKHWVCHFDLDTKTSKSY